MKIILFLWQLPQNLLGLLVILFTRAKKSTWCYLTDKRLGVSLGKYIILYKGCLWEDILHERGHQKQSLYLGWLYLPIIGLPSVLGNLVWRIFKLPYLDYYKQPWEKRADKLGGVVRK